MKYRQWIPWLVFGVPLAVFAVWAIADNASLFFKTLLNGLTLASLYFLVASGFTPAEAIRCATVYGGQIMMRPNELGQIKEGYLADLLLVDGDPLANLAILRDPKRLLAVMKDGVFAKSPEIASQRAWGRAA